MHAALAADWLTAGLRAFVTLWSFALGASVGSFLNVVVYRLPAGLALSHPKSRCPRCETPIRSRDNLPVLGWLLLRGRCRACGLPIARRYPAVEAVAGALLATLTVCVVLLGGVNLPVETGHPSGVRTWVRSMEPELIALCGALFLGSAVLLAAGLTALDGHRLPAKLWVAGGLLAVAVAAVWPGTRLDPPAWAWETDEPTGERWSLTGGSDPAATLGGVPFAPHWRGPADAALSAALLAAVAAAPAFLASNSRGNGRADGWNLVLVAALAGAWWGARAGGLGLAAGGAVWLLSPVAYASGAVRGRVPGAAWAAFGALIVPLVWFALPRFTGPPGPVGTGLCVCWLLLMAGSFMDALFFGAGRTGGERA